MKRSIRSIVPHCLVLGLAALITPVTVFAGQGYQAWQPNPGHDVAAATPASLPSKGFCPGSFDVPVTTRVAAWANGKGPLVEKQIGTKRTCTMCPVTGVASTGWANGRGPVGQTDVAQKSATHDCVAGCATISG